MNQQKKSNYRRPNSPDKRDLLKKRNPMGGSQNKPTGKGTKKAWPLGHRIAFVLFLVILGLFLWKQMNPENANRVEISYSEFSGLLAQNMFKTVKIHNSTLDGVLKESMTLGREGAKRTTANITVNIGTYDQTFVKDMVAQKIEVTIIPEKTWMTMLISILPWILFLGVWLFLLRQMQGGPKGIFSFGKSKAKLMEDHQQKVTFADVAGVEEAKVELQEVIEFLKYPKKFQVLGGKIPKGALLIGPPGTGKTLLARAVAGEAGVPFFSMSGSDFVEMFVGVGASRVRDLFEQGKTSAPCILFIDEIDAVGRQRGAGIGGGHDEREQTLNQLLVEMDGFESNEGVILLAATNRPDVLDPALLRPGRFDRNIVVDWPDVKARKEILKVHAKNVKIGRNINLGNIAKGTPGMTGADLANVVNEAALLAARLNHRQVLMVDFEEAKDKVMMGSARKSLIITDEEKKLTACHEAGHVLVSRFVPGADPVHKVSIIARGRALGLTHFLPADEKHSWSYSYIIGKLTVLLGGRAAEIIKYNDMTNGAANDIENATKMARKMVCEWGMSKRLGPLSFGKKESEVFLGREIATHKDYSEETAVAIDQEVRKIVDAAQQHAEKILRENTDKLDKLTEELLKQEILADYQIDQIFNGTPVSDNKRPSRRRRRKPGSQRQRNVQVSEENKKEKTEQAPVNAAADSKKSDETLPATSEKQEKPVKPDTKKAKDADDTDTKNGGDDAADKKDKSDKKDSQHKKGPGKKSGRSRMVRLKIGGRRRVIKKAPAQKIRKIN